MSAEVTEKRKEISMSQILNRINKPNDIKRIKKSEYEELAGEIRSFLVDHVSKTGGHLSANLGSVELTMALHLAMNFPEDKLIFDVGHQSYTHKILTGRKNEFDSLRQMGGISGFPNSRESDCDAFDTGHSSTSISAAMGLAVARDLAGAKYKVAAVIGDGALSGGMAFEALNNLGGSHTRMLIVLNDNKMSISENVGGMAAYLGKLRINNGYVGFKDSLEKWLNKSKLGTHVVSGLKRSKDSIKHIFVPGMMFEDMGITYIGPIDGHNVSLMYRAFSMAFSANKPVLVHVVTEKGRGYEFARKDPSYFHGVEPFCVETGKVLDNKKGTSYTEVFSETLCNLAKNDKSITAITAAMPQGTGLEAFAKQFPERFFDVGIAEEHAVTFAAGLAAGKRKPVFAVYSTFLQRAYDQILHDVCNENLPVVFAVDRAGIVGNDGRTHQGIFDLSFLAQIPNMVVMAPADGEELKMMLEYALKANCPVTVRYPRGRICEPVKEVHDVILSGKFEELRKGNNVCLLAIGNMVQAALLTADILKESGITAGVINMRFAAPVDFDGIEQLAERYTYLFTMEENIATGGIGERISAFCMRKQLGVRVDSFALPKEYVDHGAVDELREKLGITPKQMALTIQNSVSEKNGKKR